MSKVEWFVIDVEPEKNIRIYLPRDYIDKVFYNVVAKKGRGFEDFLNELKAFFKKLYEKWRNAKVEIRERFALAFAYLTTKSSKFYVLHAKRNAIAAYLVYNGYDTAYSLIKQGFVAGAESIYTWIRIYKTLQM